MVTYWNWVCTQKKFSTGVVTLKNRADTQGGVWCQFLITAHHRSCGLGWEQVSGYRSGSRSQAGSKSKSGYHYYYCYSHYCSNFDNLQSGDQEPAWELDLKPDITGLDSDIYSLVALSHLFKLQLTALTTVADQALGFPTPMTVKVLLTDFT
jgi:hypothetical protein